MATQFDDPSIAVPWEAGKRAIRTSIEEKQMGGLQTITYCVSMIDQLGDCIDAMLESIGDACGLNLDPDEGAEGDESVGEQMATSVIPGMAVHPSVRILLDNLPGFQDMLLALGAAFQLADTATDDVLDALGMEDDDSDGGYGYMAALPSLNVKVNRQLSYANRTTIKAVMDGMMEHHGKLQGMLESNDSSNNSGGKSSQQQVSPELSATTTPELEEPAAPEDDSTLQDGLAQLMFASRAAANRLGA
jgi:hypothetical protein